MRNLLHHTKKRPTVSSESFFMVGDEGFEPPTLSV
jgi:hypothetical protein